jgi:DNA replication protein DnaC
LKGIAQTLDQQLDMADKKGRSVSEVIYRLLMQEHKYRQERSLEYRIKRAKMPLDWTLKTFPFEKQPAVRKRKSLVDALIDRLQHRCITIKIDWPSLRTPVSDKPA